MIKIKDIIKEHNIIMTEAFKSGKLRALTNKWQGLDSTFFAYGSKLGIEWDKITDAEIETNTKPKKKGIEIAYIDKDVSVEMKGRQSYYMRGSKMGIDKFTAISVLKDGKPLWYTKSWKSIPGIKFHHINLDEDQPYMGAGIKRQMRQAAQFGAAKFTTNDEFKRINQQYFDELLRQKLNDPKKLAAKVKQAATFCQSIIDVALGGKKASGKVKTFIDKYQSGRTAKTGESEAYQLTAEVGRQLSRLYEYYGYYLGSIQKEKEEKIKYGTTDFSRDDTERYAKDVQYQYNMIMQMRF
jgi:hypothetical protein